MPIDKLKGLKGLRGFNELSDNERYAFMKAHQDVLGKYHNLRNRDKAAEYLYMNDKFIDTFGRAAFDKMDDGTENSFNLRNEFMKNQVGESLFRDFASPYDTKGNFVSGKGLGNDFDRYDQELSIDAKIKLMESKYLTPSEFESAWQRRMKESAIGDNSHIGIASMGAGLSLQRSIASLTNAISKGRGLSEAIGLFTSGGEEAAKKIEMTRNQRILDNIYNDDIVKRTQSKEITNAVEKEKYKFFGIEDKNVIKDFYKKIKKGSYKDANGIPNPGIAEFEAHIGTSEMEDLTVDEMREILAKKAVYEKYMSPMMAATALNNDAKRYITAHQGWWKRKALFANDLGISVLSYTADKANSIGELVRYSQDGIYGKPIVYVDDAGTVIDPKAVKLTKGMNGTLQYKDKDGQNHFVHQQQVSRSTLHQLGKNDDGSEDEGILNPQYWSKAEQFGTLDKDLQKQYEYIGASPYKPAYNPGDDSDMLWEISKMASFQLADGAAQLIPWGIGWVGRGLQALQKGGKVVQGVGKVLDGAGKLMGAKSKTGSIVNGLVGAGGISYAYSRGAFPETLQQNYEKMENTVTAASINDIRNKYNTNKDYKAGVDNMIKERAAQMKAEYLKSIPKDGSNKVFDEKAIDKLINSKAEQAVFNELTQMRINERKSSKEYADLQQKAIDGAGDVALNVFLTEGLKYGFVNTLGFRKFTYTNTEGLAKNISRGLKGLKEVTTKDGLKRMTTETSKFLTRGDKWKQLGKTAASQFRDGAWTNGTDDMQVDGAERINEDSFQRYLDAYQNGEAMADVYGFADGIQSYIKGLQSSLGQESTLNAALVGGFGMINSTPNFANIAKLATKKGREAYKKEFRREAILDENNKPMLNADGTPRYKEYGKFHNLGGQINYLINNGVLSNYYAKKQAERTLRAHADYVNDLLDSYDDFKDIEYIVASNIAEENLSNVGDQKTLRYVQALRAMEALSHLAKGSDDPTSMSSVIQKAKNFVDKASKLNSDEGAKIFSDEEIHQLLAEYYAQHPALARSEANSQKALYEISQNAQKLKEATKALNAAEEEIQKIEKKRGAPIDPAIRSRMKMQQALDGHWKDRMETMESELGVPSSDTSVSDDRTAIASVGGRRNAMDLVKTYHRQEAEVEKEIAEQKETVDKAEAEHQETLKAIEEAKQKDDSQALVEAQKKEEEASAKLKAAKAQSDFLAEVLSTTKEKRNSLESSMSSLKVEETEGRVAAAKEATQKTQQELDKLKAQRKQWTDDKGKVKKGHNKQVEKVDKEIAALEERLKQNNEDVESAKDPVLTADEIFALDPVSRARMMRESNRSLYSREQQKEIEKLENRLLMKDADALDKIQDIALLSQRIKTNADAYARLAKNPEGAAYAVEAQRSLAGEAAYKLINQRNAETAVQGINNFAERARTEGLPEEIKTHFISQLLRQFSNTILDTIDENNMLPEYQQQVSDAKSWNKTANDIISIIDNAEKDGKWKANIERNVDRIMESAKNGEEIINALEDVIDTINNDQAKEDVEYILKNLETIGYQRNATVVESRKEKAAREEAERQQREEEQLKREEEAAKAAEKKAEEARKALEELAKNIDLTKEVSDDSIKEIAAATGKTVHEVRRAIAELRTEYNKTKYAGWGTPSSAIGNTADTIFRDFFNDDLKEHYPNITDDVLKQFVQQLEDFKKHLDEKHITIVSKEIMAHGTIETTDSEGNKHLLPVAGTLDLFGYDDKGNFYIFDMKTTRNHSAEKLLREKDKWSRQVSLYATLLKQTYGIDISADHLKIIPIDVYYPSPKSYDAAHGYDYSVDKKSGQLKMTDTEGHTTDFVQTNKDNFKLRSTSTQFNPGFTKIDVNWDNLTSVDQDFSSTSGEIREADPNKQSAEELVKRIVADTQEFTLADDDSHYYKKEGPTGMKKKYARVTSVIGADRSAPQWMPTNQEVVDHLNKKPTAPGLKVVGELQDIDLDGTGEGSGSEGKGEGKGTGNTENKEEGKGTTPPTPPEAPTVSDLFNTDATGSVEVGKVWHTTDDSSPSQKPLMVVKENGKDIQIIAGDPNASVTPVEPIIVYPNEYEDVDDTVGHEKDAPFEVWGIHKFNGDDWVFTGQFVGDDAPTEVKAKKGFSLEDALQRHIQAKEAEVVSKGVEVGNTQVIDEGDSIVVKSQPVKDQADQMIAEGNKDVQLTSTDMLASDNTKTPRFQDTELSGNAMIQEDTDLLKDDSHVLKQKEGRDPNDSRSKYNAWMKAAGINLSNIVNYELHKILAVNPNMKVKFMAVKNEDNATHDGDMKTHLMLVVDYDNKINKGITSIHNESNGGVITSQGKQYLIIGSVGAGSFIDPRNAGKVALYDILWSSNRNSPYGIGVMKRGREAFFKEHPTERFYVNDNLSTEIVPNSLASGYIVKQRFGEAKPDPQSVSELLANKESNPLGLKLESLAWGIQMGKEFLTVRTSPDKVMELTDKEGNIGRAFVLIPNCNGKFLPSPLKPLKYNEMLDGALKERAEGLIKQLASPDYSTRRAAAIELGSIFYLDKGKDFIRLKKGRNEISFVSEGKEDKELIVRFSDDPAQTEAWVMDAFSKMNPRVNITARVLNDINALKEYDEAGALKTDVIMLSMAGSSYSIYGLDGDGKMLKTPAPVGNIPPKPGKGDYKNGDHQQVIFKQQFYLYSDGKFSLNGKTITDEKTLKQLEYNRTILNNGLESVKNEGVWNFYILENGEHPLVVKVNKNTYEAKEVPEEQSKEIITKMMEKEAAKQREENARIAMEEAYKNGQLQEGEVVVDPETGELIVVQTDPAVDNTEGLEDNQDDTGNTAPNEPATPGNEPPLTSKPSSKEAAEGKDAQHSTMKFTDLYKNRKHKKSLIAIIKKKFPKAPVAKAEDLEKFLREYDVKVDNIGTSDLDIQAWLNNLRDCK